MASTGPKKRKRSGGGAGGPRVLGSDGSFHLEKDAMGVPGFHVAVNVFAPAVHRRLFDEPTFDLNPQPFVTQQETPIQQTILHPTMVGINGPWPTNWHRIINAVRDCGLFEQATIPDNGYGLTYQQGSTFPCHWDGRGKWGEYIICATLGAPCTITFQHCAPKGKPVDPSRPWDWTPPDPSSVSDDPYWTRSMTAEEVQLGSYGNNKRRLWQMTMTLPPNSLYVMSGPSRYDWRHGINCDPNNHAVPKPTSAFVSAGGSVTQVPADEWLFPSWNKSRARRSVIYRSTKCFGDLCLQQEREKAYSDQDYEAITAVNARIDASHRFKPQDQQASRELTEEEIEELEEAGRALMEELKRSGAHRLRFAKSEVQFESDNMTRASGDVDAPVEEKDEKKEEVDASVDSTAAFSGQGRRLGQSWEDEAATKGGKSTAASSTCTNEVIDLLDSDDEEEDDDQDMKPAASSSTMIHAGVGNIKREEEKELSLAAPSSRSQSHGMSNAGRAALLRFEAAKNGSNDAPVVAAAVGHRANNSGSTWQCPCCTLINKPSALQCLCGTERCANVAPTPNAPVDHSAASMIDQSFLSAALSSAMANSVSAPLAPASLMQYSGGDAGSSLAPGHVGSLRNKHAYLYSGSGDGSTPKGDDDQDCYLMGSLLVDKNAGAYSSGGWIWTHCKNFAALHQDISRVDNQNDIERFQKEFREKHEKTLTARKSHELIVEIAKKHNVLHGKWLLNVKPESASEVWPKIRNACIAGKLGSTAKISDQPENGTFVICAYTNNFTDKKDVLRVRQAIHELGIYTKTALHYKPDAITLLDIYSGDMKGMRTTVYSCGGAATKERLEDYDCECLVESYAKCTRAPGCPRCYPKCKGL